MLTLKGRLYPSGTRRVVRTFAGTFTVSVIGDGGTDNGDDDKPYIIVYSGGLSYRFDVTQQNIDAIELWAAGK